MKRFSLRKLFKQGGPGSGHEGHRGRPGLRGGSQKSSGGARGGADFGDPERIGGFKRTEYLTDIDMVGGHLDFRQLGERGYHPVTSKIPPSAGDEIDFYDDNGDKKSGIVMKVSGNEIKIAPADEESGMYNQQKAIKRKLVDWKTGKPINV